MILSIGVFLLVYLCSMLLLSGMSLLVGLGITTAIVPMAIIVAFVVVGWLSGDMRVAAVSFVLSVIVIVVSAYLVTFLCDTAFDSYAYHLDTVVYLYSGWNPIYDPSPTISLWPVHYAKGLELMQAATLSVTGNLQSVISVNIVFYIGTMCVVWHTLERLFPTLRPVWRFMVVVMVASNTVVAQQLLSALNDYALWLETCMLTCGIALAWKYPKLRTAYLMIGMSVLLAVNTKFTHFFYIGLQCLFWLAWCLFYRRWFMLRRCTIVVVASMSAGVLVSGYNPYITNIIGYGNPVYPLGTDVVDIMTSNTPVMMLSDNRVVNLAKSLLSVHGKPWALVSGDVSLADLIMTYSMRGCAVNGFGCGMIFLIFMGLWLMILARPGGRWWIAYAVVWGMSLCFGQCWWARYVPFLWMVVIMPFLLAMTGEQRTQSPRLSAWLGVVMTVVMIAGASVTMVGSVRTRIRQAEFLDYMFTVSRNHGRELKCTTLSPSLRQMVSQAGVELREFHSVDSLSIPDRYYMLNSGFDYTVELPSGDYPDAGSFREHRMADHHTP